MNACQCFRHHKIMANCADCLVVLRTRNARPAAAQVTR